MKISYEISFLIEIKKRFISGQILVSRKKFVVRCSKHSEKRLIFWIFLVTKLHKNEMKSFFAKQLTAYDF